MTRLQELRNRMCMNMREFSTFLNVKYTTYAGYESGAREPGSDFLVLVAKKCGTTTDWLLGLSDDIAQPSKTTIINYEEAQETLRIILSEKEYTLVRAFQAADERAQDDAILLLQTHKK